MLVSWQSEELQEGGAEGSTAAKSASYLPKHLHCILWPARGTFCEVCRAVPGRMSTSQAFPPCRLARLSRVHASKLRPSAASVAKTTVPHTSGGSSAIAVSPCGVAFRALLTVMPACGGGRSACSVTANASSRIVVASRARVVSAEARGVAAEGTNMMVGTWLRTSVRLRRIRRNAD